jgi:XTP/dITP diphosphohydrolase
VCASANPHKVAEIEAILGAAVLLLPRPAELADVVEDADTLEGNARLKALAIATATGRAALADDTGLDALGGRPGVRTARFAGPAATAADNRRRLLVELAGVPAEQRGATFATVAMVCWPDGTQRWARGECRGRITRAEHGDQGFGYDSVFAPTQGDGRTFAELDPTVKHALSHRGRALRALLAQLEEVAWRA